MKVTLTRDWRLKMDPGLTVISSSGKWTSKKLTEVQNEATNYIQSWEKKYGSNHGWIQIYSLRFIHGYVKFHGYKLGSTMEDNFLF